jgi:hypothetical protein
MSIGPVTGLPFLVSAFPFMVIDTPFADVKLMVPLPAVAVNFVFCLLKRLIAVNSAADGGVLAISSSLLQLMQLLLKY